ncbi:MAG: EAL domain-containing protein [Acidimicrobiia bacterium]
MVSLRVRPPSQQDASPRSPRWLPVGRGALSIALLCLAGGLLDPSLRAAAGATGLLFAALAVLAGAIARGASPRSPWWPFGVLPLLVGAQFALVTAGGPAEVAAVLGLGGAVAFAESLRRLCARPGHDVASLVDASVVVAAFCAGLAECVWMPLLRDGLTGEEVALLLNGIPDIAFVGLLAHALLTNLSLRTLAGRLVALGSVVPIVAHVAWLGVGDHFWSADATLVLGYLIGACLVAVASLDGSMAHVGVPPRSADGLTIARVLVLGACGAVPMLLVLTIDVRDPRPHWAIGVCGLLVVALFVARLARALGTRVGDQRRESALKAGLTALLVATDNTTIELAVVLAARNLLDDRGATIRLLPRQGGAPAGAATATVFGPGYPGEPPAAVAEAVHRDDLRPWVLCVAVPSSSGPSGLLVAAVGTAPTAGLLDAFQTLAGQLGLARERAAMAEAMHRRHADHRLVSLVQNAFDVITIVDEELVVQFQSPSITAVFGHHPSEVLHQPFAALLDRDEAAHVEAQLRHVAEGSSRASTRIDCRLRHDNGDWLDVEITATNLLSDPDVAGLVLNIRDVSERKALESQLIRQAFHDPLTGLANRVLLADRVEHALQVNSRGGPDPVVLFIDLDDFKMINDSLGHPAGDRLLVELADRLSNCLRPGDTAARMGGDEFAVLLENAGTADADALRLVAERVLDRLTQPLVIDGTQITPRASIGVASGAQASSGSDLLRNADLAMYMAKAQGGGVALFEPSMHDSARRRLEMQAELARALDRNEFEVHFQPIVAIGPIPGGMQGGGGTWPAGASGDGPGDDVAALLAQPKVMGVEALARWNHPQRGRIPPVDFIPIAEETGLIVALGRWILIEACRTVASWASDGMVSSLSLTVNVSARQLQETSLVDDVAMAIALSGIDPSWLVIEITESVVMRDTSASVNWLHALKQLGVRIAIDDFGTGYSSLAYLQLFPIDVMKIDRSFVLGLGTDPKATELVRAVINLSESLGMTTLAEGIETEEQLSELRRLGCQLGQGFAFAKPMSSGALITAVEDGLLTMAKPGPHHPGMHPGRELLGGGEPVHG